MKMGDMEFQPVLLVIKYTHLLVGLVTTTYYYSPLKNSWQSTKRNYITVGHTVEGIFHISYYFIAMK